ncbi:MAG TPA: hypothetical protein V6D33_13450 [Cyanophyceae cyanobacterium]
MITDRAGNELKKIENSYFVGKPHVVAQRAISDVSIKDRYVEKSGSIYYFTKKRNALLRIRGRRSAGERAAKVEVLKGDRTIATKSVGSEEKFEWFVPFDSNSETGHLELRVTSSGDQKTFLIIQDLEIPTNTED